MKPANWRGDLTILKCFVMSMSVISILFIAMPAFAIDEDIPDLGIEMKKNQGQAGVVRTLEKTNAKLDQYEKAKADVAQVFTGIPKEDTPSMTSTQTILLKKGQSITGSIREKDENGFWVETEPGVNVYFRNDEVESK